MEEFESELEAQSSVMMEVKRWKSEIEKASKSEKNWREKDAKEALDTYGEEKENTQESHFNILWSNTEVSAPSLYSQKPVPDVRQRFKDANPLAKHAAQVIERGLSFYLDAYDFDAVAEAAVFDRNVPGRAVTRVVYDPSMETKEGEPTPYEGDRETMPENATIGENGVPMVPGESYETLAWADLRCESVAYDDFRRGPGKKWSQVPWVAFRHRMTKDEFKENFPKIDTTLIEFNIGPTEEEEKDSENVIKRTEVWELWDKAKRVVRYISFNYDKNFLKVADDPLNLSGFFPVPEPLYAVKRTNSLVPVTLYKYYKRQAKELDKISGRINALVEALRVRGVYDSTMTEVAQLFDSGDNVMIPAQNTAITMENGGLDKAIWFMPVEQLARVLAQLYIQREQIKQVIYEITGLSDILRGSTDPNETLGAQQLKAQTGGTRLKKAQLQVQRYIRDLLRMKAEIMVEHFSADLLQMITGLQVDETVLKFMRDDSMRLFNIDIETDSTIAGDEAHDKEQVTEMLQAMTGFVNAFGPAVASGDISREVALKIMKSVMRRFKMGREVEDAMEETEQQQPQQQQGDPAQNQQLQMEMQAQQEKVQSEMQISQQKAQNEMQIAQAKAQAEMQLNQQKLAQEKEIALAKLAMEREVQMMRVQMEASRPQIQ